MQRQDTHTDRQNRTEPLGVSIAGPGTRIVGARELIATAEGDR